MVSIAVVEEALLLVVVVVIVFVVVLAGDVFLPFFDVDARFLFPFLFLEVPVPLVEFDEVDEESLPWVGSWLLLEDFLVVAAPCCVGAEEAALVLFFLLLLALLEPATFSVAFLPFRGSLGGGESSMVKICACTNTDP